MISCREATELASKKLDGATGPGERLRLALHLAFCAACRAAERQMRLVRSLAHDLRHALPERMPEERKRAIRARLAAHGGDESGREPER